MDAERDLDAENAAYMRGYDAGYCIGRDANLNSFVYGFFIGGFATAVVVLVCQLFK